MKGILILGAGGHGKVIADILLLRQMAVIGFLDDDPTLWNTTCLDLPVLGKIDSFMDYQPGGLVVGIGSNKARYAVVQRLGSAAQQLWYNAIHPSAIIAKSAKMGHGVVIVAGAILNADSVLGNHVIINTGATVDHDCVAEDYAHVAPGVHLTGGAKVGEGTLVGAGAVVAPYCSIGTWGTIGAGAVVVRDIPDGIVARGVPARWDTNSQ